MSVLIERSAILNDFKKQGRIEYLSKIKNYILCGFLSLIAQLVTSGHSVIIILFIKKINVDIIAVIYYRAILSSFVILYMAYIIEGSFSLSKENFKREMSFFTLGGLIYNYLTPLAYIKVNILTSGSYAALFTQTIPIFTLILSYMFGIEKPKSWMDKKLICQIFGTFVGCGFAVAVLIFQFKGLNKDNTLKDYIFGTTLNLVVNLIIALNFVYQTKIFYRNPDSEFHNRPLTTQAFSVAFGGAIFCIIFIPYAIINYTEFIYIPPKGLIPIIYASILVTPVSKGLMSYVSKKSSPIIVGASYSLSTIISLIFLRIFANESLSTIQYILFIGVIFGVLMVVLSPIFSER